MGEDGRSHPELGPHQQSLKIRGVQSSETSPDEQKSKDSNPNTKIPIPWAKVGVPGLLWINQG